LIPKISHQLPARPTPVGHVRNPQDRGKDNDPPPEIDPEGGHLFLIPCRMAMLADHITYANKMDAEIFGRISSNKARPQE
jgi:hypothetical protein